MEGNNNNTTERQSDTTQLTRNSHFSKNNWLARVYTEVCRCAHAGEPGKMCVYTCVRTDVKYLGMLCC